MAQSIRHDPLQEIGERLQKARTTGISEARPVHHMGSPDQYANMLSSVTRLTSSEPVDTFRTSDVKTAWAHLLQLVQARFDEAHRP
jgi:hypothetical protein